MCGCPFAVPAVDRPEMERALRPILGPGGTGTLGTQEKWLLEKWLLEVDDRVIARGVSSGERPNPFLPVTAQRAPLSVDEGGSA